MICANCDLQNYCCSKLFVNLLIVAFKYNFYLLLC